MYAISLWQPYASLIAEGIKVQETRNWAPPKHLIGERIAIHAAKRRLTKAELRELPSMIHHYSRKYAPLYIAEAVFKFNRKGIDIFSKFLCQCLPMRV